MSLELIPIKDLIDELHNRFESSVIAGAKNTNGKNICSTYHKGNWATCIGLCHMLTDDIKKDINSGISMKNEDM